MVFLNFVIQDDSASMRKEGRQGPQLPDAELWCSREGNTNSVVESSVTCHVHNEGQLWLFMFKKIDSCWNRCKERQQED